MLLIFKGCSFPKPRCLQYLKVNLRNFAHCSESLRKRFRSLQNAPKMPPSGPPGPLWRPMEGLWSSKLSPKVPKRHLKCPKGLPSDPQNPERIPPEFIVGLLDANFAALALILHNILVNSSLFNRILTIFAELEQMFDDFQHGVRCPTRLLVRRRGRRPLNLYINMYIQACSPFIVKKS